VSFTTDLDAQDERVSENEFDTDVFVVGTGPAGASCALALATYGVRVRVATRWNWLANSPRAHITNQRAMEVLRDLGVEQEAKGVGTPWELMGDMLFVTSLAGRELARLHTWGRGESRLSDYLLGSPCSLLDIPQPLMEPILVENAAARGAQVLFNTEYLSHTQDSNGVTSRLQDRLTGHEYSIRSRFLVAADGANSLIAEQIGIPIEGQMARAGTIYARFGADLTKYIAHRPGILHRIMIPAHGEIGMSTLRAVKPWTEWIAGWGWDISDPEPRLGADAVVDRIRRMIGDPDVPIDLYDVTPWKVNQAWAIEYSAGRVHCAGDAVHRHPPSSGLGSNTSIQDSFNLAWKLAYVIKQWADLELLRSYSAERAPVGKQVVARANQSRADYALLNALLAASDPDVPSIATLADRSAIGVAARDALVKAVEQKNHEFNGQGVELNHRYRSRAVVPEADEHEEVWDRDRELYLQASTRPGAKMPHVWLIDHAGNRLSTLDVVGKGMFTVVTGIAGVAWADAVEKLDLPFVRTAVIGSAEMADPYHDWHRIRGIHEAGALLVRPDCYVAWRHAEPVWDAADAARELQATLRSMALYV
jgi:2,4-dichlorophenol 6-monooxygenase